MSSLAVGSARTTQTHAVAPSRTPRGAAATSGNEHLLPPPQPLSAVPLDLAAQLAALTRQRGESDKQSGDRELNVAHARKLEQSRKMAEAAEKQAKQEGKGFFGKLFKMSLDAIQLRPDLLLRKTVENVKDLGNEPNFWQSIMKDAMTVAKIASVAISVCALVTGPGALGAVGFAVAIFSACAMLESELKLMEKLGVSEGAASKIRIGAAAVTAVAGGVGALVNAGASAANTAATVAKTTQWVQAGAKATQATGQAGVAVQAQQRAMAAADEQDARNEGQSLTRQMQSAIARTVKDLEACESTLGMIQTLIETRQQSTLALAAGIGGRA